MQTTLVFTPNVQADGVSARPSCYDEVQFISLFNSLCWMVVHVIQTCQLADNTHQSSFDVNNICVKIQIIITRATCAVPPYRRKDIGKWGVRWVIMIMIVMSYLV